MPWSSRGVSVSHRDRSLGSVMPVSERSLQIGRCSFPNSPHGERTFQRGPSLNGPCMLLFSRSLFSTQIFAMCQVCCAGHHRDRGWDRGWDHGWDHGWDQGRPRCVVGGLSIRQETISSPDRCDLHHHTKHTEQQPRRPRQLSLGTKKCPVFLSQLWPHSGSPAPPPTFALQETVCPVVGVKTAEC